MSNKHLHYFSLPFLLESIINWPNFVPVSLSETGIRGIASILQPTRAGPPSNANAALYPARWAASSRYESWIPKGHARLSIGPPPTGKDKSRSCQLLIDKSFIFSIRKPRALFAKVWMPESVRLDIHKARFLHLSNLLPSKSIRSLRDGRRIDE